MATFHFHLRTVQFLPSFTLQSFFLVWSIAIGQEPNEPSDILEPTLVGRSAQEAWQSCGITMSIERHFKTMSWFHLIPTDTMQGLLTELGVLWQCERMWERLWKNMVTICAWFCVIVLCLYCVSIMYIMLMFILVTLLSTFHSSSLLVQHGIVCGMRDAPITLLSNLVWDVSLSKSDAEGWVFILFFWFHNVSDHKVLEVLSKSKRSAKHRNLDN